MIPTIIMRNSILVTGWLHTNVRFLSNGIHRLNHARACQFARPFSAYPIAFLRAEKTNERWDRANSFWKGIAGRMERVRPKPVAYFEATYHVALALQGGGHKTEGLQTLKSVLTLSPTVGNAEMKKKYQELITVLSR